MTRSSPRAPLERSAGNDTAIWATLYFISAPPKVRTFGARKLKLCSKFEIEIPSLNGNLRSKLPPRKLDVYFPQRSPKIAVPTLIWVAPCAMASS